MLRLTFIILLSLLVHTGSGQYNWKLAKNNNGIYVYKSDVANSVFKAIKVECTLTGSYAKLINILTNISQFSNWIYHSKTSKPVEQNSVHDFIYYTETHLPWPLSNRDAVIHLRINTDSLPAVLNITGNSAPGLVPEQEDKVRVKHYKASWRVTMPAVNTIQIHYVVELDPGGSIPGWVANMFVEKGPYETFNNLANKLKE